MGGREVNYIAKAMENVQSKKVNVQMLAEILDKLPEGDKRKVLGYVKCLYASKAQFVKILA